MIYRLFQQKWHRNGSTENLKPIVIAKSLSFEILRESLRDLQRVSKGIWGIIWKFLQIQRTI